MTTIAGKHFQRVQHWGDWFDDDFFMLGVQPFKDSNYLTLTGNFLDSEGELLFRIVRNVLKLNPGMCSKIVGDQVGYEIHVTKAGASFQRANSFPQGYLPADSKFRTTISWQLLADKNP